MTLFIDMMSIKGHVNLNSFYLSNLSTTDSVLYISRDLEEQFNSFTTKSLGEKPSTSSTFSRLMTGVRVILVIIKHRPERIVFLSYDLLTFPLISYIISTFGIKALCFEHNTAPCSNLKRFLQRITSRSIQRLVYAPHILSLYSNINIKATYVPHPCIPVDDNIQAVDKEWQKIVEEYAHRFEKIAICPSASVSLEQIEKIADQYSQTLFICKSTLSTSRVNIKCLKYFEAYAEALKRCDFVCVLFPFEHKVSGPVFEAIAMGKAVMVLNNQFGKYMKSLFPEAILFPSENNDEEYPISIEQYNKSIIKKITEYMISE